MDKRELQKIVEVLQCLCGKDDMASVKINSEGKVYFSVGMSNYPVMTISEFADFMEK